MPMFGFGPGGHPTPSRRRRQAAAVSIPRQVQVCIDERPRSRRGIGRGRKRPLVAGQSTAMSKRIGGNECDADVDTDGFVDGASLSPPDLFTPRVRNRRKSSSTNLDDEGMDYLALPALDKTASNLLPSYEEEEDGSSTGRTASPLKIRAAAAGIGGELGITTTPRTSLASSQSSASLLHHHPTELTQQQQQKEEKQQQQREHKQSKQSHFQSREYRSDSIGALSAGHSSFGGGGSTTAVDDELDYLYDDDDDDPLSGGGNNGYDDDEDGGEYDPSLTHGPGGSMDSLMRLGGEDVFETVVMRVSLADAVVILEYPEPASRSNQKNETNEEAEKTTLGGSETVILAQMEGRDDVPQNDSHPYPKHAHGRKREGTSDHSSDGNKYSDEEDDDSDDSDDYNYGAANQNALALPPLPPRAKTPPFELISTNIHSVEDEERRKMNEIRLAVLDAAAKAYKEADIDAPDVLLCQINECRSSDLKPRTAGSVVTNIVSAVATSAATSRMNSLAEACESSTGTDAQAVVVVEAVDLKCGETKGSSNRDGEIATPSSTPISAIQTSTPDNDISSKVETENTGKPRIRRLQISRNDEVHVLPCQCAFNMIGMQGLDMPGPSLLENKVVEDQQLLTQSLLKTPTRRPSLPAWSQHSAPGRTGAIPTLMSMMTPVRSNSIMSSGDLSALDAGHSNMKMAKTPSAQAAVAPRTPHSSRATPNASPVPGTLGRNRGGEDNAFKALEYHEITLIRKSTTPKMSNEDLLDNDDKFVDWDAFTIRCRDHDEMDAIISALKTAAKARIVPFSPDPRAKLKKKREQEARERRWKEGKRRGSRRKLRGNASDASLDMVASGVLQVDLHKQDGGGKADITSPITPPSAKGESSRPMSKRKKSESQGDDSNLRRRV